MPHDAERLGLHSHAERGNDGLYVVIAYYSVLLKLIVPTLCVGMHEKPLCGDYKPEKSHKTASEQTIRLFSKNHISL